MNSILPDFDVLVALYRHDPGAFENFRRHMLRAAVDHAPPENRATLEQLLVHIEAAREAASDPMEAALNAFRLMQASVTRLHDGWQRALEEAASLHAAMLIEQARMTSQSSPARMRHGLA